MFYKYIILNINIFCIFKLNINILFLKNYNKMVFVDLFLIRLFFNYYIYFILKLF